MMKVLFTFKGCCDFKDKFGTLEEGRQKNLLYQSTDILVTLDIPKLQYEPKKNHI